tara:strand:- start:15050 stop:16210 length:1161 start_codon:yes stop_codon:yes gene_type:complete
MKDQRSSRNSRPSDRSNNSGRNQSAYGRGSQKSPHNRSSNVPGERNSRSQSDHSSDHRKRNFEDNRGGRKSDTSKSFSKSDAGKSNERWSSRPPRDNNFGSKPRDFNDKGYGNSKDKPIRDNSSYGKNKFSSFKPAGKLKFRTAEEYAPQSGTMRLNRFLAHAGICSRREADNLIADGLVTVNGTVITEMGTKVQDTDQVRYGGELLKSEKKVYVLLNKPKGFITTVDDEKARKTVMDLVSNACSERIYPVGRLDRSTTGVLLLTNDGMLAKKLTHPSHGAKKIYMVTLEKPFHTSDLVKLRNGIELEDGMAQVDYVEFVKENDKYTLGVEIHIGKNRIVRRMFEALGYEVSKLDRSSFAGLTKKGLNRGQYKILESRDLSFLKML